MSGEPFGPSWAEDDAASFGEGVARSTTCGCHAPLTLDLRETLIVIRCSHCQRLTEHHSVYAEGWES